MEEFEWPKTEKPIINQKERMIIIEKLLNDYYEKRNLSDDNNGYEKFYSNDKSK
ncbi:MAG: hypothetical protein J5I47_02960 [Vicingus serpentipes]|nr:hypothetical protein [Vicingus serpentipes]